MRTEQISTAGGGNGSDTSIQFAVALNCYVHRDADDLAAEFWQGQDGIGTFVGTWPETFKTELHEPRERKTEPVTEQRVALPE